MGFWGERVCYLVLELETLDYHFDQSLLGEREKEHLFLCLWELVNLLYCFVFCAFTFLFCFPKRLFFFSFFGFCFLLSVFSGITGARRRFASSIIDTEMRKRENLVKKNEDASVKFPFMCFSFSLIVSVRPSNHVAFLV